MDEKKELCSAIACFIEKYWRESKKVIKPKCQCVVHGVGPVQIEEDSLTCVRDNLYTFEGSANVTLTDVSKVTMNSKLSIIGNATVVFYPNGFNTNEMLPEIQEVEITKVKP